jgi:hypothetical protein
MFKTVREHLDRMGSMGFRLNTVVRSEIASLALEAPVSRLGLWRKGFGTRSALLYRLEALDDCNAYVSELEECTKLPRINWKFRYLLNNKLLFGLLLENMSADMTPTLGLVEGGRFIPLGACTNHDVLPVAEGLARLPDKQVLKPLDASGGNGVVLHACIDGIHHLDGREVSPAALEAALGAGTRIVCAFVEQAAYARRIFPDVTNTMRILTMYDADRGEAFIAGAAHRFGRRGASAVADNWAQGGISCGIDPATGTLDRAMSCGPDGRVVLHDAHPDTGARIRGIAVDGWHAIREGVLRLAARLPFVPYIGWDIAATDDGFRIIEGNSTPSLVGHQMHRPLLADERVRRFYARHGVRRPHPRGAGQPEPLTS